MNTKLKQFQLDSARFDNSNEGPREKNKVKPNSRFKEVPLRDQGDQWRNDKKWQRLSNPYFSKQMDIEDNKEKRMLEKRHHAHKLKNIALQQDVKALDRKIIKELKAVLF